MTDENRKTAHAIAAEVGMEMGTYAYRHQLGHTEARRLAHLATSAALRGAGLDAYATENMEVAASRADGSVEHEATKNLDWRDRDESRAGII